MKRKITILTLFLIVFCFVLSGCRSSFHRTMLGQNQKKYPTYVSSTSMEDSPEWVSKLAESKNATQIFVVAGVGETTAYVSMHEKDSNGNWKEIMTTPGYIGKHGLGKEKEGDGKTPVGDFHFTEAFGIESDPGVSFGYKKVTENDWWSGDPNFHYNTMVNIKDYPDLNKDDSEHIIDYTNEYKFAMNISYNETGEAGKGSAIFLHCLGAYKPYTGGCVAIPHDKMLRVLRHVNKDCVVVIDSLKTLSPETWEKWGL